MSPIAPRRGLDPTLTAPAARKPQAGVGLLCLAVAIAGAGGTLHAFRWATPAGSVTISRIGVLILAPIAIPFIVRTPTRYVKRMVPAGVAARPPSSGGHVALDGGDRLIDLHAGGKA